MGPDPWPHSSNLVVLGFNPLTPDPFKLPPTPENIFAQAMYINKLKNIKPMVKHGDGSAKPAGICELLKNLFKLLFLLLFFKHQAWGETPCTLT